MKPGYGASALLTVALGIFLCPGCGPANEDSLKGESKVVPQRSDVPNFKGYGEAMQYYAQQAKEKAKSAPKKAR